MVLRILSGQLCTYLALIRACSLGLEILGPPPCQVTKKVSTKPRTLAPGEQTQGSLLCEKIINPYLPTQEPGSLVVFFNNLYQLPLTEAAIFVLIHIAYNISTHVEGMPVESWLISC